MVIRTPPAWGWEKLGTALRSPDTATPQTYWEHADSTAPVSVRRVTLRDLGDVLARGFDDLGAYRIDVLFLCVIYPLVGLLLARLAFGYEMLPLVFPLASGFALIGPFAAVGLNEMSRRREMGQQPRWTHAFQVLRSPALGRILALGFGLVLILVLWLLIAQSIYQATLGPRAPASIAQFVHDVLFTPAGWAMTAIGIGVGFLFALFVFSISIVAFPMLLDRNVSLDIAIRTSIRAVAANPVVMAVWGMIIVAGLIVGSLPALLGLVIVMPVLGHATWHLYRRVVTH